MKDGGLRSKSWEQIPWGVDAEIFHPGEEVGPENILFTGQVAEHKGVHLLLEAFSQLVRQYPTLKMQLTIAGPLLDADYKRRLDAMVEENGLADHVEFTGRIDRGDLPDLDRRHAIYVFPSIWEEPMGIGILEAMASGLAVVCSGAGGSGELFTDGESGLLFKLLDSNDLLDKISSLLKDRGFALEVGRHAAVICKRKFNSSISFSVLLNKLENSYPKT